MSMCSLLRYRDGTTCAAVALCGLLVKKGRKKDHMCVRMCTCLLHYDDDDDDENFSSRF